uniref:Uncharacterized protein n=1 Tax=Rhizophora mucronata TaxID=61149 RepID=A0A2P2IIK0_RHIMU
MIISTDFCAYRQIYVDITFRLIVMYLREHLISSGNFKAYLVFLIMLFIVLRAMEFDRLYFFP